MKKNLIRSILGLPFYVAEAQINMLARIIGEKYRTELCNLLFFEYQK